MAKQQTETSFWDWLFGNSCCGDRENSHKIISYSPPQENSDQSWFSSLSCAGERSKSEHHSNMEHHHHDDQKSREPLGTGEFEEVDVR